MPGAAKPGSLSCRCRAREPQLRKPCTPRPEPECRVPTARAPGKMLPRPEAPRHSEDWPLLATT